MLALALCSADSGGSTPGPGPAALAAGAAAGNGLNDTLPAEQYFIDKIFDKYGDKGVITFEVSAIVFLVDAQPDNHTIVNVLCSVVTLIEYLNGIANIESVSLKFY